MNRLPAILLLALLCSGCLERTVRISTHPAGAKVFVNDRLVGTSPCTIHVPPPADAIFSDPYIIEAHADHHLSAMYYLPTASANTLRAEEVELRLTPLAGTTMLREAKPKPFPKPMPLELDPVNPPDPATTEPVTPDPVTPKPAQENEPAAEPAEPIEENTEPVLAQRLEAAAPAEAMRFNCEVRLIRMSDGKTLVHASTLGAYSDKFKLADLLAERVRKHWPRGRLAVITFRNRRHSPAGKSLAIEMTDLLASTLGDHRFGAEIKTLDLEKSGIDNHGREHPDVLKNKALLPHLKGADYVLLGGVSETNE